MCTSENGISLDVRLNTHSDIHLDTATQTETTSNSIPHQVKCQRDLHLPSQPDSQGRGTALIA